MPAPIMPTQHSPNTYPQGDLGRTDLQDDLEFHNSTFSEPAAGRKPGSSPGLPPPATAPSGSGGSGGKRMLWTIGFYAQFFDVDTSAVLSRCWAALFPRANFLDVLEGNPDLYGPFWIATTVVLILFLGGTISDWVASEKGVPFAYNFKLLSGKSTRPQCSSDTLHVSTEQLLTVVVPQAPRASSTATRSSSPSPSSPSSATSAPRPPTSSSAGRSTATRTSSGFP